MATEWERQQRRRRKHGRIHRAVRNVMNEYGFTRDAMRQMVQESVRSTLHHYVDSLLQQPNVQRMILDRVTDICWRPRPTTGSGSAAESTITQWLYHVIKDAVSQEVVNRLSIHMQPLLPGQREARTRSVVLDPPARSDPASP